VFLGDLTQFDLFEFDVILGMNWLITHGVSIGCEALGVLLKDSKGQRVCFYGDRVKRGSYVISAMKVCKILRKGSIGYWFYALKGYFYGV